jgi:hypothetical protein
VAFHQDNEPVSILRENRIDQGHDSRDSDDALARLHRSGWSIGDAAFHDGAGGLSWLVWGSNGENLIRVEGATRAEAWGRAVTQARGLGMLGRRSVLVAKGPGRGGRHAKGSGRGGRFEIPPDFCPVRAWDRNSWAGVMTRSHDGAIL